jgi:hypothetical protein
MSWRDRDPLRQLKKLLGGDVTEFYTPNIARELAKIASERNPGGEPSVDLLLRGMNSFQIKELRVGLQRRLDQRAQEVEEARRKSWLHDGEPPVRSRGFGTLGFSASGAIIDTDERSIDDAREQARARSLEARSEAERAEREADRAQQRAYQAADQARTGRELPPHLR